MLVMIFQFGSEVVNIILKDKSVYFGDSQNNLTTIDGLKLNRAGVELEFPDLKDDEEWKAKAIERFKEKIKSFSSEVAASHYIVKDLSKYGYEIKSIQRKGFRVKNVN